MIRSIFISLSFLFSILQLNAQNLNGTWEGNMSGGEKLQVNIQVNQKEICGYTADYVTNDRSSYCKANFKGWYDNKEQVWVLVGTSFIENSGEHILMILRLWHQKGDPKNMLRGSEEPKYGSKSMFGMGDEKGSLWLKKTSPILPKDMPDCFPEIRKTVPAHNHKVVTVKPSVKNPKNVTVIKPTVKNTTIKPVAKTAVPVKTKPVITPKPVQKPKLLAPPIKTDTSLITLPVVKTPTPVVIDQPELVKRMNERKKMEFSHIIVHDKNITLRVYDNGIVDNDSVSIFYNGRLIAGNKRLSEKPIVLQLQLDENVQVHEITMFAENLGSIAPNTALIVVTAGDKRYELHSSSSLTENAVLSFEYVPK